MNRPEIKISATSEAIANKPATLLLRREMAA
jgi:hypothetical protein